jgi:hypothetical protein
MFLCFSPQLLLLTKQPILEPLILFTTLQASHPYLHPYLFPCMAYSYILKMKEA